MITKVLEYIYIHDRKNKTFTFNKTFPRPIIVFRPCKMLMLPLNAKESVTTAAVLVVSSRP